MNRFWGTTHPALAAALLLCGGCAPQLAAVTLGTPTGPTRPNAAPLTIGLAVQTDGLEASVADEARLARELSDHLAHAFGHRVVLGSEAPWRSTSR